MSSLPLLTPTADQRLWKSSCGLSNAEGLFDVELATRDGTQTEMVHSFMLAVHSRYFAAVLMEARKGDARPNQRIRLDLTGTELRALKEFVYTGRIGHLDFDQAQELTKAADRYMLPAVMTYCSSSLVEHIDKENCINMYKFAHFYHSWDLANSAYNFALRNIWPIVQADDATEFCQLDNRELQLLLSNDHLNTPTEGDVFDVIWKWIRAAPDHRMQYMESLLGTIRCGLISCDDEWCVLCERVGQYCKSAQKLLAAQRRWPHTLTLWYSLADVYRRPRVPIDVLFCIGGWSSGAPTSKMEVYDSKANRWFECPSVEKRARAYHGIAVLNGFIYVIGGYDRVEYFNSTARFNPRTREWSDTSHMHTKRCYVNVAAHNGRIYAAGGSDGQYRHNSVECYEPDRNQWSVIAPMHKIRSDAGAAFLDGKLYVAGGFNGQNIKRSVERYDPETNSWEMVSSMHTPRSGMSLIAHEGHLYAIGGNSNPNSNHRLDSMERATIPDAERYDVIHERWEKIEPMMHDRSALKICVFSELPNPREYTYHGCQKDQSPAPAE